MMIDIDRSNNNNNANDARPRQEDIYDHNVTSDDNETGSATTRFTVIIEADVNPVLGNSDNYHEVLNEMFVTDRELGTVYAIFGLQRVEPPKILDSAVQPSLSCLDITGEDSNEVKIEKTSSENLGAKLANAAINHDDDDDESRRRQQQKRRDQPRKSDDEQLLPILPNVMTKGIYPDLDTFTRTYSRPDRSRLLSDHLWKNIIYKLPQLSLWHRINGEYKLSARASEKEGGPGTFFRIRKYHVKTGGPKQSILDVLMSLSERYEEDRTEGEKQEKTNHDRNERSALERRVTSYEILTSLDPDRNQEILEIVSWKDESSYIQMMMDLARSTMAKKQTQQQNHKTSTCSSSSSPSIVGQSLARCTISVKNLSENASDKLDKETASITTNGSRDKGSSLLAYTTKIDKMVKYYCDSLDESFWNRAPNGFHVPIKVTGQKKQIR